MIDLDRRLSRRVDLQVPVRLQSRELLPKQKELATRTINVSDRGLLLKSPTPLTVGRQLMVKMRVPTDILGTAFSAFAHRGRVVHETRLADGAYACGIQLEEPKFDKFDEWT